MADILEEIVAYKKNEVEQFKKELHQIYLEGRVEILQNALIPSMKNALMKSEHRDYIATEWSKDKRQDYIRGCVLGLLKEGGVIKGSMDSIARSANVCDNYRTFSRYMGQSRQEPYADWVLDYLRPAEK